jgi:polysaccharide biosynthesis transport protein
MRSGPTALRSTANLARPKASELVGRGGRENERGIPRGFGPVNFLRRHWRLVGLCGACFLLLATLFLAVRPARYTASTHLLVYTRELHPTAESVISPGRADVALVQNQIEILRAPSTLSRTVRILTLTEDAEFVSDRVVDRWLTGIFGPAGAISDEHREKVERAIEAIQKRLSVKRVGMSHTIDVSMTTSDPDKAARIANEIVKNAPQEGLGEEAEGSRTTLLRERLQGLGPSTYVMSMAYPPVRPDGPRRSVLVLAATMFGVIFGGGLAILLDFRDRKIRTAEQVEALGLECLGLVSGVQSTPAPKAPSIGGGPAGGLSPPTVEQPHSMTSQTLRRVQAAIRSSGSMKIGVTSDVAGAGATALATSLARQMSASGKTVLLVCDSGANPIGSRAPIAVAEGHDPANEQASRASTWDAERESGRLSLLTLDRSDGPQYWSRMDDASNAEGCAYDILIAVLPPLLDGPEFRIAAEKLQGLLLVLEWGRTDSERLRRLLEMSGNSRWKFIGAVLNMANEQAIGTFASRFQAAEAKIARRRSASNVGSPLDRRDRPFGDTLPAGLNQETS